MAEFEAYFEPPQLEEQSVNHLLVFWEVLVELTDQRNSFFCVQVREDVKQFGERMEELESMKWSLKSESIRTFEELSVHKQALRVWQNELEGSLEEQIKNMVKDKTDLEAHVQRLVCTSDVNHLGQHATLHLEPVLCQ